jgi:serine/threonine-protein kinase
VGRKFGRYHIVGEIGRGGMAEVFLAVQKGPGGFEKPVALKLLQAQLDQRAELVERFLFEAKIAGQLAHPNICHTYDAGLVEGRHYLAMEYLPGQSVASIARASALKKARIDPRIAAYVVARAAEGLAYAHEKTALDGTPLRIVHRDVSPSNIFVTYDGQVKLLDFGIASGTGRTVQTVDGQISGKISYMSPEQIRGESVDARSDLFALGVVLYELLECRRLFPRLGSDYFTMQRVLSHPIPPIENESVIPALASVTMELLARDKERRTPSARQAVLALDEIVRQLDAVSLEPAAVVLRAMMEREFAVEAREAADRLRGSSVDAVDPTPALDVTEPRPLTRTVRLRKTGFVRRRWRPLVALGVLPLAVLSWSLVVALQPPAVEITAAAPNESMLRSAETLEPLACEPEPPSLKAAAPADPSRTAPVIKARRAHVSRAPALKLAPISADPGRLTLDTVPWSDIYLDGRKLGTTPLFNVELPAGHQILRARNEKAGVDRALEIDIQPGRTTARRVQW